MSSKLLVPPPLRPGDPIAVVAPAGPVREDDLRAGLAKLALRYTVCVDPRVFAKGGYLAGPDADRLASLQAALDDPDVRAVIAARGGYGTARIVDGLDLSGFRRRPKLFVGSSDLTVLGCLLAREGFASIHGPMVETLGRAKDDETWDRLVEVLEDPAASAIADVPLDPIVPGRLRGPVLGGNLSILASLVGTGTLPPLRGAVLFLEDVGERPYRIDRMLTQLLRAGSLDSLSGVLLGDFPDCTPKDDEPPALAVFADRLAPLRVPVLSGYPAAHSPRFLAIRIGETPPLPGS